ncbi:hypothetical protein DSCW_06980 [Desulfosarcina widdelii]|uniref:Methyltransferase type 11 n=1 Tax=Desulfosarcina widdelii TaxID=947919 RepID=A0A5K7Z1B9_9BACT|nr:methyltransferase domain-containing protein [Desulfosarcina widdelii]BBO73281.1 hypothetical protein DSCW_06980 [Desulfosarcina widdelii]
MTEKNSHFKEKIRGIDYFKEKIEGIEYKYSTEWIQRLETEEHWRLYWNQQKIMQKKIQRNDTVLEIGVGSGFTANYLKSKGYDVKTIDIDSDKNPDIISNIVTYDFKDSYDHILAFEVFEHIPFAEYTQLIKKLSLSCKQHLFLSVPRNEKVWMQFGFTLPFIGTHEFRVTTLRRKVVTPSHFWEVDDGTVSMKRFEDTLRENHFSTIAKEKYFSRLFYALHINRATSRTTR